MWDEYIGRINLVVRTFGFLLVAPSSPSRHPRLLRRDEQTIASSYARDPPDHQA
jgi:hypothetical protein